MTEERTEEATPRHERRARERGRAWQSRDLALGAVLLATGAMLHVGGTSAIDALRSLFAGVLAEPRPELALERSVLAGARLVVPLLAAMVASGALVSAVQVRGLWAPAAITPDASRLDPSSRGGGIGRAASTFALGLARLALVLAVAGWTLLDAMPGIATLSRRPPEAAASAAITFATALALRTGIALAALGVIDAIVERALHLASLRMTRREREREQRDAEGDPHLRRERDRVREAMHREDDLESATAAAIVIGGDALAVALHYDASDPDAVPRVAAIGRDARAEEIVRVAARVVVDETLADRLAIVPVGDPIPEALYELVARAMRRGGP